MIDIYPLFSGSSGNAILICSGKTNILIDCGVSGKRADEAISAVGKKTSDLQGIFVTHEHSDHILGVNVLSRRFDIDVYATEPTWQFLNEKKFKENRKHNIDTKSGISIGDLEISCFKTPHDAACSVGYRVTDGLVSVAVATDMGTVTPEIKKAVTGCQKVLLESNHDINMLEQGPYPRYLKERIRSKYGHLSNADAASFAVNLAESGTEKFLLGHLSRENNMPMLAQKTVAEAFAQKGINCNKDVVLRVASMAMN